MKNDVKLIWNSYTGFSQFSVCMMCGIPFLTKALAAFLNSQPHVAVPWNPETLHFPYYIVSYSQSLLLLLNSPSWRKEPASSQSLSLGIILDFSSCIFSFIWIFTTFFPSVSEDFTFVIAPDSATLSSTRGNNFLILPRLRVPLLQSCYKQTNPS